jgi:hypothetical protein
LSELERIERNGVLYALIVRQRGCTTGVDFITEPEHSQQVGYIRHNEGTTVDAHFHNTVKRIIFKTQEVLIITRGKLRCDLYDRKQRYLQSATLEEGDLIVLLDGGHGFSALADLEMIEIKQGPYLGSKDKTRFTPEPVQNPTGQ